MDTRIAAAAGRPAATLRRHRRLTAVLIAVLLIGIPALSVYRQWGGAIYWESDGLFYQSMVLQVQGKSEAQALHEVFEGPMAARARSLDADEPGEAHRVTRPAWVSYSAQFYQRRWLMPVAAAAVYPVFGEHSLETLSLLGYCLLCPLLYLLLRLRFTRALSMVVALACIALPPLRNWTLYPLTDSWGLCLMVAAVLAGVKVIERGPRWLPAWAACIVGLALIRDMAFVMVAAAAFSLLVLRNRRTLALVGTAVLATAPWPLFWGGSTRDLLAYVANDNTIPPESTWGYVLDHYWHQMSTAISDYAHYATANPLIVAFYVLGLAGLVAFANRRDPLYLLLTGTVLGFLAFLALGPTFSNFRYELMLIPAISAGLALVGDRVTQRLAAHGWALPTASAPIMRQSP